MTGPTGKINSVRTVTKKAIHIIIVQTRRRKRTTTAKRQSLENKVKLILKTCPNILRKIRILLPLYKLR